MPSLSIPEAIVDNLNLDPTDKFFFAQMFAKLKKGEKVELTQGALLTGNLTREDLIRSLRDLVEEGYAYVDESTVKLDDMIREQTMRLTVHIHAEVLPLHPTDEMSVSRRRNPPAMSDDIPWDYAQVGRMVYRATLSGMTGLFDGEYALTVRARHGDLLEQTAVIDKMTFRTEVAAWAYFDSFVEDVRGMHKREEVLPGAAGDDPHGPVVEALVEQGWSEAEAREASEATIGEGDPQMRLAAAQRWLARKEDE